MFKLWSTIVKDFLILSRDKVGLTLMFVMPVLLVLVITSVQVSTFELINENKVSLILCNKDDGEVGMQLVSAIRKTGMFEISEISKEWDEKQIASLMHKNDALLAVIIPKRFSYQISLKAKNVSKRALNDPGILQDTLKSQSDIVDPLILYYHPVLQESYRASISGALRGALQLIENKQILKTLYFSLNEKGPPESLERDIINNQTMINEIPVSRNGSRNIPNASQHNVPAWTIFAMFFIVISLGSNIVREKLSGSFIRLKTLPTNYLTALFSKQIIYIGVSMAQVVVIFSIGVLIFPFIGLPKLNLPADLFSLFFVSLICGWCAVSYAMCVGVFAQTQEQANGFGAVSIVILAAIGGILVPGFAMPDSFQLLMKISPLYWCLESYYALFLEGGRFEDVLMNILPLCGMILFIQLLSFSALKRKNLI